ncbi:MAG: hypothetical protein ACRCST_02950 [Turicibacter sp.]
MKRELIVFSVVSSAILGGCSNTPAEVEPIENEVEINQDNVLEEVEKEEIVEDVEINDEEQMFLWMEGTIESIEETEMGYLITIVPWAEILDPTFEVLTVTANTDLEIKWSTSGEIIEMSQLPDYSLVSVDVVLYTTG